MRKKSHRRRWEKDPSAIYRVMGMQQAFTPAEQATLNLPVREALQEAKKACENLPAPESCSGVERSLWDVATMACAEAVGKLNGGNNAI